MTGMTGMTGLRKRACGAIALVMVAAWCWHHDAHEETTSRATGPAPGETARGGIGELIARLPSSAQLKLHPLFVLEGGLRLEGQTIDEAKHPVAGVKVTLNGARSVVTEADGSFAFDHLAEADYSISAEQQLAYAEDTVSLTEASDPLELEMKVGVGMKIHVEDTSHQPIRDAAVVVGRRNAITDATGNASVRGLDFNGERLTVTAAGYAPQERQVETGDDPRAQLAQLVVLEPGAMFAGTVVDENGTSLAEGTVYYQQAKFRDGVEVDAHGHFEVPLLGPGKVVVTACSDEHLANPEVTFTHDGVHARHDVVIHVTTGSRVTGLVVDQAGTGVRASIHVRGSTEHSDEHGHFLIKGLAPGVADVTAENELMAATKRQIEIRRGVPTELRIQLVTSSIAGIVRDSAGQPVEGVSFSAAGKNDIGSGYVRSDEDGKFDFGGLPPGEYEVSAQQVNEHGAALPGVTVHTGTRNLSFTVQVLGSVAGRVVEHGVPVAYYGVVVSEKLEPSWTQTPDPVRADDGAFHQSHLRPGSYSIAIVGSFERKVIQNVEVTEGGVTQLGDITVDPGKVIRGVVRDESGAPIAGAHVAIASRASFIDSDSLDGKAEGTQTTRSDGAGNFEIAGIAGIEGEQLTIQATRDHDMSVPREIAAEVQQVEVVIRRAGSLDGTIVNFRGSTQVWAVEVATDTMISAKTDQVGGFHFERLLPGDYRVELYGGTTAQPQLVHIEGGATVTVSFEMPTTPIAVAIQAPGCKKITLKVVDSAQGRSDCVNGVATFEDIEPGTYKACVDPDHCGSISVTASPNQQTVALQIQPDPAEEPSAPDDPAVTAPDDPAEAVTVPEETEGA